ncbi:MAG: hypothetical protein K6E91_11360 [Butyrivibrio sp.]|nr:hypothetical protein [Butyrivibrio sp.]
MSTKYFIDSENVGDNWVSLLDTVSAEDEILVFYTANSPHMNYKNLIALKNSAQSVTFIECFEGSNALDFQLCTELGFQVNDIGDSEFIIVTNDTGYDAVVKYWNKRNVPVKRITGKACVKGHQITNKKEKTASEEEVTSLPAENVPDKKNTRKNRTSKDNSSKDNSSKDNSTKDNSSKDNSLKDNTPKDSLPRDNAKEGSSKDIISKDSIPDEAKEILFIIGRDQLQPLHESLHQIFGENGKTYYNIFKSNSAYNTFIANHAKMSLGEKYQSYCQIVFAVTGNTVAMPEDFPSFVTSTWRKKKNLNSFRSSLMSHYGKETGEKCYSLIKAHVKILDKIKE